MCLLVRRYTYIHNTCMHAKYGMHIHTCRSRCAFTTHVSQKQRSTHTTNRLNFHTPFCRDYTMSRKMRKEAARLEKRVWHLEHPPPPPETIKIMGNWAGFKFDVPKVCKAAA